ncbi:MFS transporter [Trinickia diaoshuihuensis]|uniref:MFS transporter n=1 Tax=Trinickia diaoshuihuensis TaxID=2292265 RepID=UPI001968424A|nr:MFS transporter [Trinickia diaoshuihuensis]
MSVLSMSVFFVGASEFMLSAMLNPLSVAFGTDSVHIAWLIWSYAFAYAIAAPFLGYLSDRIDRGRDDAETAHRRRDARNPRLQVAAQPERHASTAREGLMEWNSRIRLPRNRRNAQQRRYSVGRPDRIHVARKRDDRYGDNGFRSGFGNRRRANAVRRAVLPCPEAVDRVERS